MVQACGSEDNRKYSVLKLEQHLQYIVKDEKLSSMFTKAKSWGVLGTQSSIVAELDQKFAAKGKRG